MAHTSFTDAELAALYQKHAHVLFWRCRSILKSDEEARDAVHETFAAVLRHADEFRRQSSPMTWMYRISTNWCLNQLRNRQTRARKLADHAGDLYDPDAREVEATEDHARILALLAEEDDETRRCVVHTWFDDCTREEVAALVGLSVPTVRKRINQFLDRARHALVPVATLLALWSLP
jgi:RNA polymerase sigma factor (sigma-70 family)